MATLTFDTHEFVTELKQAGLTEPQAEAITRLHQQATSALVDYVKHEHRCMPELVKLCARRMLKIPTEIEGKEKGFGFAQQRYDDKEENLRKIGYTSEQVANFLKDEMEKPCEESHKAELSVLRKELGALDAFTRDYPKYDQRLLIGTPFENWKPENEEAFDKAAGALAQ